MKKVVEMSSIALVRGISHKLKTILSNSRKITFGKSDIIGLAYSRCDTAGEKLSFGKVEKYILNVKNQILFSFELYSSK